MIQSLNNPLSYFLIFIVIFLIGRELMAWYWKTNEIIRLLEKIEENTRPKDYKKEEKEPSVLYSMVNVGKSENEDQKF